MGGFEITWTKWNLISFPTFVLTYLCRRPGRAKSSSCWSQSFSPKENDHLLDVWSWDVKYCISTRLKLSQKSLVDIGHIDIALAWSWSSMSSSCLSHSQLLTSIFSSLSSKLVSSSKLRLKFGLSFRQWTVPFNRWSRGRWSFWSNSYLVVPNQNDWFRGVEDDSVGNCFGSWHHQLPVLRRGQRFVKIFMKANKLTLLRQI